MMNKLYFYCLALFVAPTFSAFGQTQPSQDENGYYLIESAEHLKWFRDQVNASEPVSYTHLHIFNHLHLLGKQLILTSDKAPVDLQGMEERLITRLKWGLTAELDRPDLDLRKKILKNKISHDGVVIPDDVFNFIASNVTENVRDVEGIVASLLAYSTAFNRMIDLPLTKQVVSRVVKLEKKQVSVESIQDVVCKYYNLELAAIQTNSRKREIVQARQVTMYLAKKYTDSSFSHIGKIVGKRDHATVLHACKTVRDQIETNKSFRSSVEEIEALLKACLLYTSRCV